LDPVLTIGANKITCEHCLHFGENIVTHDDHVLISDYESVRIFRHNTSSLELVQTIEVDGKGGIFDMEMQDSTLALGFGEEDGTGNVFIYQRSGDLWVLKQELRIGRKKDAFGWSIDIEGDFMVVGAPAPYKDNITGPSDIEGRVYIFRKNADTWILEEELTALPSQYGDKFGTTVAIHNGLMLAGSAFSPLHIYELDGTWEILRINTFNTYDLAHSGDHFLFIDVYYNTNSFILEPDGSFFFFEVNFINNQGHNPLHTASHLGDIRGNLALVAIENNSYCYLMKYENSQWTISNRIDTENSSQDMITGTALTDEYIIYGASSPAEMEYVAFVEY